MSYDILFKKKGKDKLTKQDLQKLEEKFTVNILEEDPQGKVIGFALKYKDNQPDWIKNDPGFEVILQDDGSYMTYISYSATEEMLNYFLVLTKDLSNYLQLYMKDPQTESSKKPDEPKYTPEQVFKLTNKIMDNLVPGMLSDYMAMDAPAKEKFFIRYYFISEDLVTSNKVFLFYNTRGIEETYDSRVLPGESIKDVVNKEIFSLIGSSEWTLSRLAPEEKDYDRHGNLLGKYQVILNIPYFDPSLRSMKFPWQWKNMQN